MRILITENYLNNLLLHYTEKYRHERSTMGKTIFTKKSLSELIVIEARTDIPRKVLINGINDFHLDKMHDMFTKEKRSEIMSKIRPKESKSSEPVLREDNN